MLSGIKQLKPPAGIGNSKTSRTGIRGKSGYFIIDHMKPQLFVMDIDTDPDDGRLFGIDPIFESVLDKRDEQEWRYPFISGPAIDGQIHNNRTFKTGLL